MFFFVRNMVLLYIRLVFMMPLHLDMDGILPGFLSTALVVPGLPLTIPFPMQKGLSFDTT